MLIEFGDYTFNANDFSYAHKIYYSETNTWGIQIHLISKDDILFDEFANEDEVNSGWYKLMADVKKTGCGLV